MSVLVDKNTRLLVQGITGRAGGFHAKMCMEYGTNLVAGVTPARGGEMFEGKVPVFDTVDEARRETGCNATMVFVPAEFAADSILEALDVGIKYPLMTMLEDIWSEGLRSSDAEMEYYASLPYVKFISITRYLGLLGFDVGTGM